MDNTTLDDIAGVIGYTGTRILQAWYGGHYVYLPAELRADAGLAHLLGMRRYERLWQTFRRDEGYERLWIPADFEAEHYGRLVGTAKLLCAGETVQDVADRFGVSLRQAENYRSECMRLGWIVWDTDGPRRYRLAAKRRRKISGTGEVFQTLPPS